LPPNPRPHNKDQKGNTERKNEFLTLVNQASVTKAANTETKKDTAPETLLAAINTTSDGYYRKRLGSNDKVKVESPSIKVEEHKLAKDQIKFPLKSIDALSSIAVQQLLSSHEKTEITEYEDIYYLSSKKYQPTKLERLVNNGYDDSDGYYRIVSGDQIAYRFELFELIGKGAFGQVLKCKDHKTGELVAIKMVKN